MKLSTKLLAILLGIIMVGMLTTQIFMKAEYDRLKNREQPPNTVSLFSKPFKHIYVESPNMFAVYVRRNDNYDVTLSHSFKDSIKVYIQNDTLRIRSLMNDDYYDLRPYSHRNTYPIQLTVDCPSVSSVYSNQNYVSIAGFKQKNLKFIASNRASILNNTIDDFELVVNKKGIVNFGKNGDRTAKEEEPEVSEKNYLNTFGILQINLDTSSTVIFKNSFEVNKILLKTSKNNHLDGLDEDLIRKIEVLK